jgi:hypothetical protein
MRRGGCGACWAAIVIAVLFFAVPGRFEVHAQSPSENLANIALKSGESVTLGPVYWVVNCKSIMIGVPTVEVLEGPPELSLSLKEDMVLPRRQNCAAKVKGAVLTATAGAVKAVVHAKLTFRLKYQTKDGDRQSARVYDVSLFP